MNQRQQAMFLWDWARKRRRGRLAVALVGAGIGAIGGLVFALLMLYAMTSNGGAFYVDEEEAGPILGAVARTLGPTGFLFVLSLPAFAGLGAFLAQRVWGWNDYRYHSLLEAGAIVPPEKPAMTAKERAAKWAVVGGFALGCLFLIAMLISEINRGAL
ncbi:MAG TPA: hypothetical protein VEA80_07095 [Vitreimonas sp.]|uniref:hypothetical protein n=1 Tax=Vitreimonas sp. TaxID=3069702 RepID=UPI002D31F545|nr:hypothetical protein [Vitreimonas sp.]HYD87222.1 hypothetical protein [Vitreimonas sp.]